MELMKKLTVVAMIVLSLAAVDAAQDQCELQRITAPDAEPGDFFGPVGVDGNVAVIGSRQDDGPCPGDATEYIDSGSVHVFRRNGTDEWVHEQQLCASDRGENDQFGWSVSIDGDLIVVGAPQGQWVGGVGPGWAYVFRWTGSAWEEEWKLVASDGQVDDGFGWPVSVSGDVAVIGAAADDDLGVTSGSAYVFRRYDDSYPCLSPADCEDVGLTTCVVDVCQGVTWVEEQKLWPDDTPEDPAANDEFGMPVCIDGNAILVGAHHAGGVAYVFRWTGSEWIKEQKLRPSDTEDNDLFGRAGSIEGDVLVVGSPHDDDACPSNVDCNSGSVYVFRRLGDPIPCLSDADCEAVGLTTCADEVCEPWVLEQKLRAIDEAASDLFGHSEGDMISGDMILIGAQGQPPCPPENPDCDFGSAYLFQYAAGTWVEKKKLTASDGAQSDRVGRHVSLDGDTAFVSSPEDDCDGGGEDCGAVYVFSVPECIDSPIPTVSDWGMVVMTLLLLTAGTLVYRARRTATA